MREGCVELYTHTVITVKPLLDLLRIKKELPFFEDFVCFGFTTIWPEVGTHTWPESRDAHTQPFRETTVRFRLTGRAIVSALPSASVLWQRVVVRR